MRVHFPDLGLDLLPHGAKFIDPRREISDPEVNDCTQLSQIVAFSQVL